MSALPFFDCNCMIGARAQRHQRSIWQLDDYRSEFDYYDIVGAVVHHAVAAEYSPDYGNRRLLREIGDDPQLVPQWVLLPHHAGEMPPPDELVAEMLSLGVRTARLLPTTHRFGTAEYVIGELLSELERHRLPLFLDLSEVAWHELVDLCQAHPLLPVVLCGVGYGAGQQLYPSCQQCPNLYVETHRFQDHQAYQRFVAEFGENRLLFGTGLPHCSPGSPHMMTLYQDIPKSTRPMIAGSNLLQLLEGVTGVSGRPLPHLRAPREHPDDDPIVASVRAGRPLSDEFIIDCHGHLAHPGAMGAIGLAMPGQDADSAIISMDRLGVDILAFSMWSGLVEGDAEANDLALEAVARYPDRLMAYGCYNTRYPEIYQAELERVFYTDRVIGIKPYGLYSRVRIDDPVRHASYQWASDNHKPILGCGSFSAESQQLTPQMAMRLAERYPGAAWIISHATSSYQMVEAVIEACSALSNIYAEVCYSSILYAGAEMLYESIPLEQILYGSDAMMRDPASQLGWMCWARIPYQAKQRILGQNFADILGMAPEARTPRSTRPPATQH